MTTHSQRALILYRRRRFINHLLTYLQGELYFCRHRFHSYVVIVVYVCLRTLWYGWLSGTAVERWSSTGELSLTCARPAADG